MSAPEGAAISIVGLTKRFGSQTIWDSGTGKSVLLKHFVGPLKPTAGHVYVGEGGERRTAGGRRNPVIGEASDRVHVVHRMDVSAGSQREVELMLHDVPLTNPAHE